MLADWSARGLSPKGWAELAAAAYDEFRADRLVAEVNQGGAMVEEVVRQVSPNIAFTGVNARVGKRARAETAIARHIAEPPPSLPTSVPVPLSSLILQLLEKTAAARPQSASEVIQRLQEIDAGLSAAALPAIESQTQPGLSVARPSETRAPLWRRPLVFAGGALTLVGLGAWLADTVAGDAANAYG